MARAYNPWQKRELENHLRSQFYDKNIQNISRICFQNQIQILLAEELLYVGVI